VSEKERAKGDRVAIGTEKEGMGADVSALEREVGVNRGIDSGL
jgi:hypothetical protein